MKTSCLMLLLAVSYKDNPTECPLYNPQCALNLCISNDCSILVAKSNIKQGKIKLKIGVFFFQNDNFT